MTPLNFIIRIFFLLVALSFAGAFVMGQFN